MLYKSPLNDTECYTKKYIYKTVNRKVLYWEKGVFFKYYYYYHCSCTYAYALELAKKKDWERKFFPSLWLLNALDVFRKERERERVIALTISPLFYTIAFSENFPL